jgi:hypothetical protein
VGKKSIALLAAVCVVFAMLSGPFAVAADVTREGYKASVEPICKRNTKANERILRGVRKKVTSGKLKPAGIQFIKAGRALHRAIKQLRAVPQPTADEARLAKWLKYVVIEEKLFLRAGKKLKSGQKNAAQILVLKLNRNATRANNQVLPFEFKYCRFDTSKFT